MGKCRYCGEAAGFMRSSHRECRDRHDEADRRIRTLVRDAASGADEPAKAETTIREIAREGGMNGEALREAVISGWELAVERAFEDGVLSPGEEDALTGLARKFSLSRTELNRNGAQDRVERGAILRAVLEGDFPELAIEGNLPFNLQKTEKLVWAFENVDYLEERVRTRYEGGSRGVSVRVARGVYYRAGGFKGERVQTAETVHADTGLLGLTDKHIYFAGPSKRFRIRYDKIVAFEPYSDGIGIQRDAQTARPQSFVTGDGWFAYNLVRNLASR